MFSGAEHRFSGLSFWCLSLYITLTYKRFAKVGLGFPFWPNRCEFYQKAVGLLSPHRLSAPGGVVTSDFDVNGQLCPPGSCTPLRQVSGGSQNSKRLPCCAK